MCSANVQLIQDWFYLHFLCIFSAHNLHTYAYYSHLAIVCICRFNAYFCTCLITYKYFLVPPVAREPLNTSNELQTCRESSCVAMLTRQWQAPSIQRVLPVISYVHYVHVLHVFCTVLRRSCWARTNHNKRPNRTPRSRAAGGKAAGAVERGEGFGWGGGLELG